MPQKTKTQIIVIGGGPGGISAGIQLKRYGLEPLLLERRELGGLLWNANLVENYPGFPNGVRGGKLINLMSKQIKRLGVDVKREEVLDLGMENDTIIVATNKGVYEVQTLIVASGTKSKPLPVEIPLPVKDRVFTEVWPLLKTEEKQIVVVGGGDAAFDYALNLVKKRNFVTILNRGENVKCLSLLFERAAQEPGINYRSGAAVKQISFNETTGGLRVLIETEVIEADYILFAIGRVPNLDFLSEEFRRREQELIESGRLYFVGDVINESFRQAVIAAGDGLRAAMQIYARKH